MKFVTLGLALAILTGCGGSGGSTAGNSASISKAASKDVLFNCVMEAGITGQFSTTFEMANGVSRETVNAGNGVTQAQANAANQCIAASNT